MNSCFRSTTGRSFEQQQTECCHLCNTTKVHQHFLLMALASKLVMHGSGPRLLLGLLLAYTHMYKWIHAGRKRNLALLDWFVCVRLQISQEFHGVDKWIQGEAHAVNNASGVRESALEVVYVRRGFTGVARHLGFLLPSLRVSAPEVWSICGLIPSSRLGPCAGSGWPAINRRLRPASSHEVLDQSLTSIRCNQSWKWLSSFQITTSKFYCIYNKNGSYDLLNEGPLAILSKCAYIRPMLCT